MENRVFSFNLGSYIWFLKNGYIVFDTKFYAYVKDINYKRVWIRSLGTKYKEYKEISIKSLLTFGNSRVRKEAKEFLNGK